MASAMAAFNGDVRYNSATFSSATAICEIESASISLTRELMDATNRCVVGKKRYVAGELDSEITLGVVVNKDASGGSKIDLIREMILENIAMDHVWVVDEYDDGYYCSEMFVTALEETQNMGEVIKANVTLKPNGDLQLVLNGAISSGSQT